MSGTYGWMTVVQGPITRESDIRVLGPSASIGPKDLTIVLLGSKGLKQQGVGTVRLDFAGTLGVDGKGPLTIANPRHHLALPGWALQTMTEFWDPQTSPTENCMLWHCNQRYNEHVWSDLWG